MWAICILGPQEFWRGPMVVVDSLLLTVSISIPVLLVASSSLFVGLKVVTTQLSYFL